jgi:hypothetical protein
MIAATAANWVVPRVSHGRGEQKKEGTMDIGRSFSYITEDEDWWKQVLIGGLLTLIPVIGPFYAAGYMVQAVKNVIDGRELPLPDALEDFGDKLVKGLILTLIMLIYALPLIVIGACSGIGLGIFSDALRDPDAVDAVGTLYGVCFGCFGMLYGILLGLVTPFVYATYADTGELGAALKLGRIWGMLQKNIGPAFIALLVAVLAGMLASVAGLILCGIGLFATSFFANLVIAHVYGSLYQQARPAVL